MFIFCTVVYSGSLQSEEIIICLQWQRHKLFSFHRESLEKNRQVSSFKTTLSITHNQQQLSNKNVYWKNVSMLVLKANLFLICHFLTWNEYGYQRYRMVMEEYLSYHNITINFF